MSSHISLDNGIWLWKIGIDVLKIKFILQIVQKYYLELQRFLVIGNSSNIFYIGKGWDFSLLIIIVPNILQTSFLIHWLKN